MGEGVTRKDWEELAARVARLEQALGLPTPPLPSSCEGEGGKAPPYEGGVGEVLLVSERFAALGSSLDDAREWAEAVRQGQAIAQMIETQNLETWLTDYPTLFVDAWEKLKPTTVPQTAEEQQASELLTEFCAELEQDLTAFGISWIVPHAGQTPDASCEIIGREVAASPAGTVARCVRRGLSKVGRLLLPAQITLSTGQGQNVPVTQDSATIAENVQPFTPGIGAAFDGETMEIVGTRRTAYLHEDNTVSRVETAGTMQDGQVVNKARVIVYRTGDGL
jgi:molecular chaperone GrpE (heat shock protein)